MTTTIDVKPLAPNDPRVSVPLYTIHQASRYLGMPYERVRLWVRPGGAEEPLITAFAKEGHRPVLAFAGFAEAFVLSIAYRAGMHPESLAKAIA